MSHLVHHTCSGKLMDDTLVDESDFKRASEVMETPIA